MALDKKEIALTVGGILATIAVAFLIYRLQRNDAAQTAQQEADSAAATESALANQQAEVASLPGVSVAQISSVPSSTPSTTDTTQQSQVAAPDPNLEAIIAAFGNTDQSSVTSAQSPSSMTLPALPILNQQVPVIPEVPTPPIGAQSVSLASSPNHLNAPIQTATGVS